MKQEQTIIDRRQITKDVTEEHSLQIVNLIHLATSSFRSFDYDIEYINLRAIRENINHLLNPKEITLLDSIEDAIDKRIPKLEKYKKLKEDWVEIPKELKVSRRNLIKLLRKYRRNIFVGLKDLGYLQERTDLVEEAI